MGGRRRNFHRWRFSVFSRHFSFSVQRPSSPPFRLPIRKDYHSFSTHYVLPQQKLGKRGPQRNGGTQLLQASLQFGSGSWGVHLPSSHHLAAQSTSPKCSRRCCCHLLRRVGRELPRWKFLSNCGRPIASTIPVFCVSMLHYLLHLIVMSNRS